MRIRCQESDLADKIPISPTIIIIIRVYKEKLHEEKWLEMKKISYI